MNIDLRCIVPTKRVFAFLLLSERTLFIRLSLALMTEHAVSNVRYYFRFKFNNLFISILDRLEISVVLNNILVAIKSCIFSAINDHAKYTLAYIYSIYIIRFSNDNNYVSAIKQLLTTDFSSDKYCILLWIM